MQTALTGILEDSSKQTKPLRAATLRGFVLGEGTTIIDVGTKYEIYKMMNEMTEQGMSIIMINSDMEELLGMSDRILVIREGKLAGELSREEACPESVMNLAVGGQTNE